MGNTHILIVEDDQDLREALGTTLELAGFEFSEADCAEAAIAMLGEETFDLIISDVNMPGINGDELLELVGRQYPGTPFILMTAFGQISQAVNAMQMGAVDYLVKPFEASVLVDTVNRVMGAGQDEKENQPIAVDAASKRLFQLARKVAATDSTVMISGESGSGKEVLARFIHNNSHRKKAPFVAINCAAIPENMLEAMLFGHEKGAFTGAYNSAPGKFEQANGGTLLLDEISEMEIGLQAKLLRVLQEREVERVGGRKPISLDVRVVATTNRDLKDYVAEGKFREDLYYRLTVFPLHWKPLRERREDILPLAERLLNEHSTKMRLPAITLDESARQALLAHPWPGNVRELDNAIQRSLILQQGNTVTAADLSLDAMAFSESGTGDFDNTLPDFDNESVAGSQLGQDLRQREFQIIIETLKNERGKRKQAAEKLGISPRTLRYKLAQMRDCGIDLDAELAVA